MAYECGLSRQFDIVPCRVILAPSQIVSQLSKSKTVEASMSIARIEVTVSIVLRFKDGGCQRWKPRAAM